MNADYAVPARPSEPASTSASIWKDSRNSLLNDLSIGAYAASDFVGTPADPAFNALNTGTTVISSADPATYGPTVVKAATGGSDNNSYVWSSNGLGRIQFQSGLKFWFETRFAPGALNDSAFFFGLVTAPGLTATLIADNPSNSAQCVIAAVSHIGFASVQAASALATVNAVYAKGSATEVVAFTNVTNSAALLAAASAQNSSFVNTQANLVANSFRKYGIRFDGISTISFYVDGVLIGQQAVDTTVDQAVYYALALQTKTGTAAATTNYVDFLKAGAELR